MRTRLLLTLAAALGVLIVSTPAAGAKPALCTASVIEQTLKASGRLDPDVVEAGIFVSLIRCGDVTADGATDVVFTLGSGGTAGDTRFGVIEGGADGAGEVVLLKTGYKVGVARHDRRAFDVMQPYYGKNDPNCCRAPSARRATRGPARASRPARRRSSAPRPRASTAPRGREARRSQPSPPRTGW